MELEWGSGNIKMAEDDYSKIFGTLPRRPTGVLLKMYDGIVMNPLDEVITEVYWKGRKTSYCEAGLRGSYERG